jgi:hypothetical protein
MHDDLHIEEIQMEELEEEFEPEPEPEPELKLDDGESEGEDPIFVALLEACREAGYDDNHQRRQYLIQILEAVQAGESFPDELMEAVMRKAVDKSELEILKILKPQVHVVLAGMRNAVQAEEERLAEICRLEEENRAAEAREKQQEYERTQQQLSGMGLCPMGYTWHQCGSGWRCAGGSHYISSAQLGLE